MADEVIRRDIIEIDWKINSSPLDKLKNKINNFPIDKLTHQTKGFGTEFKKQMLNSQKSLDKLSGKLDKVASKLGKGMVNAAKKASKAIGAMAVAGSVGAFKLADMASDLDETLNKVSVSFGEKNLSSMEKWAKTSIKNMGMAQQTALDMAAGYGDMATSMGLSQDSAMKMSKDLVARAADIASFKNLELDEVNTALNGIFTGETESLKRLGVVMTQTNLEAFAKSQGKVLDKMSESEKVTLRYQYVLQKTSNAQDDFERTGGGFANQLRMAKEQLKEIGTTIGGAFVDKFAGALKKVNDFATNLNSKLGEVLSDGFQFDDIAKIAPMFGVVGTAIQRVVDKIKTLTSDSEKMNKIRSTFGSIKTAAGHVVEAIGKIIEKVIDFGSKNSTLDFIKGIFDKIGDVAKFVGDNISAITTVVGTLGGAFLVFYGIIKGVNTVVSLYNTYTKLSGVLQGIQAAKTAFSTGATFSEVAAKTTATGAQIGFNTALLACPITWIIVGIVALVAAVILLAKNWDKVKETAVKVWNKIKEVWGGVKDWFKSKVIDPVAKFFKGLWEKVSEPVKKVKENITNAFQTALDGVKNAWSGIKDFFAGIWKGAVEAVAKPVNKLIGGANWVLDKLGSDKKIAEWQPYARGTNGHRGGNAIVNDGRGAELVQMPNGRTFIPRGRNVLLPNAPKGMKVLDAERTARLMGKGSPTFHYEDGTGWDIWNFFDNAKGLVKKVIDKFVSFKDMGGYALDVAKAMISKATSAMSNWIKGLFNKFGGKDISSYVASEGVKQWESTVIQALKMEGLHTADNVKRTLMQMQTESGGNPRAINNWDVNARKGTPSKGLMQVIDPTFKAYAKKGYNKNIYDPLSNILASVRYASSRYGSLAKAYRGVGYANGVGIPRIPLGNYRPENTVPVSSSSSTSNNNYSPSFTLNMNGTVDRTTERTIKKWVMEALEEVFDSISRTSPRITEV